MQKGVSAYRSAYVLAVGMACFGLLPLLMGGCPPVGGVGGNVNDNVDNDNVDNGNDNIDNDNVDNGNDNGNGTTARTYVGSERCADCHPAIYDTFRNTGHPYKINKIVNGAMPTYPFSSIEGALEMVSDSDAALADGTPDPNPGTDNTLGAPNSYDDVSYVIGGFGWKARFMDSQGYIVTGSSVQYNLATGGMVAYDDNVSNKAFDCGNCHTTGWKAFTGEPGDLRNPNHQDNLPGIAGTFAAPGIQCEACHGAGSEHVGAPSKENITKIATPRTTEDFLAEDMAYGKAVACSECHTRDGEMDYPTYVGGPGLIKAKGGFIQHHEQYDELIGIDPDDADAGPTGPHRNLPCTACHDQHKTTKYMAVSGDDPGMDTACTDCHDATTYEITTGGMAGFQCITCHMPRMAKSAVSQDAVGTGPVTGDIRAHIFRIDVSAEDQFTDDGAYAYPRITGSFACKTCHNGETNFNIDFPSTMSIHGN